MAWASVLGFVVRDEDDRSKVIANSGGKQLTVKAMHKLLRNPIYAGINSEKWTDNKPIRCVFNGLVSIDLFNRANRGKRVIIESPSGEIAVHAKRPPEHLINKGTRSSEFPFKKFVLCPQCKNPLTASSSRGKSGKQYPAYHCSHHGHYYRIPKQELEDTIAAFTRNLTVSTDHLGAVMAAVSAEWHLRNQSQLQELQGIEDRITQLKADAASTVAKIRILDSPTALKFMEEDLVRIEQQITALTDEKAKKEAEKPSEFGRVMGRVKYFVEHLDEVILQQIDPVKRPNFSALFSSNCRPLTK
ncbi:zinc ribbon domain-containing protein [bacterium]|nr:MAG: zinc ribbon domain-containing protein [bacterium]